MKNIFFLLLSLIIGNTILAQGSWNAITGKNRLTDSVEFLKPANNSTEDSVLTLQYLTGKLKLKKVTNTFIIPIGVDSVTLYNNELCEWMAGISTCWFLTPGTGGSVDSFHLNFDSLYILQYRNGTLIDSIFLLHTYLYVDNHFSLTPNYLGDPYKQLLNATRLVDSTYIDGDTLRVRYGDGDNAAYFISGGGSGSVTDVSTTNGLGILSSVANSTTTPDITIAVDTSSASILSRQRAAATYYATIAAVTNGFRIIRGDATADTIIISGIDTTSLSNRINLKVNISDTAAMLSPYKTSYPRLAISLTTTGSGAATYSSSTGVLNVPTPSASAGWLLVGNAATAGSDFAGTTNSVSFRQRVNNIEALYLDSSTTAALKKVFIADIPHSKGAGANYGSIGIGDLSLWAVTTGAANTALGDSAMRATTTGDFNVAIGGKALEKNTSGEFNTAVGWSSQNSGQSGTGYNSTVGYRSLFTNTTGLANNAVGGEALFSNTTSNHNNAFGFQSMYANTTGGQNTAMGGNSLHNGTTGSYVTALGYEAFGTGINTGDYGIGIGRRALYQNTSGTENIGVGWQALNANTTGSYNLAFGTNSMLSNISGTYNIGLGRESLLNNVSGIRNIALGPQSGQYSHRTFDAQGVSTDPLEKSDSSIYIGYIASAQLDSQSRQIVISTFNGIGLGSHTAVIGDTTQTLFGVWGNLQLKNVGNKFIIPTGSNASIGVATLSGGTVTVNTTAVTASSIIFLTDATTGVLTNVGTPTVGTIVAGTSFVINSSNIVDASNVNWIIYN